MKRKRYDMSSGRAIKIPREWFPSSAKPGGIFFFLFFCGVIAANMMGKSSGRDLGVMSGYFMDKYIFADIQGREIFLYLFYQRFFEFFWIFVLSVGIYGMLVLNVYCGYLGFSFGFLSVVCIMNYGAKGVLLMTGFLFPQYLFYIPALLLLYYGLGSWKKSKRGAAGNEKANRGSIFFLALILIICGLFFFGILMESYVNPFFLQKIIKNI